MSRMSQEQMERAKAREALGPEERRTRAMEDIADQLHLMRGYLADISIWTAHIGRNWPVGRNR